MFLDLIIRGTGCSGSPAEHVAAVASRQSDAHVILFGPDLPAGGEYPAEYQIIPDSYALAQAIAGPESRPVLVYGGEELLGVARHLLQIAKIWVVLRAGTHEVREVWRLRQQHPWMTSKKLGLLFEKAAGDLEPDTKHLMRLTRASEALVVPVSASPDEAVAAAVQAPDDAAALILESEEAAAAGEATAESEVVAPAEGAEPEYIATEEPADHTEAVPETETSPSPDNAVEEEGAMVAMETIANPTERTSEVNATPNQPEQALMQRYNLVKERRSTAARLAQVQENMENLLKELFVTRFAAGPEAAAAFEQTSRKLTDTSAEFTQLTRAMAQIEQGLAKLAWLKDELEI